MKNLALVPALIALLFAGVTSAQSYYYPYQSSSYNYPYSSSYYDNRYYSSYYPTYPTYPNYYDNYNNYTNYYPTYPTYPNYQPCVPTGSSHGYLLCGGPNITKPTIRNINGPTSLTVGALGTWFVTIDAPYGSYVSVNWDDDGYYWGYGTNNSQNIYVSGTQVLTFTHVYRETGRYDIEFDIRSFGSSDTSTETVRVKDLVSSQPSISSLSTSSGGPGTTITIYGSEFTDSNNDVHFGIGGKRGVSSSNNGTRITYTIPSWISQCDLLVSGYYCGVPIQPVTPGSYTIYVTNAHGLSNIRYFTVE